MRKSFLVAGIFLSSVSFGQSFPTVFEKSNGNRTPDYTAIISWWQKLDAASGKIKMLAMGMSDAGYPLHLVMISNNGDFNFDNIHRKNKRIIFFNNGIHPGEPDGIDASMLLARDIVTNTYKLPDNIILAIIPVYNIGGCLDRSTDYRVDQNGPEAFGFRGNSQNLDLNRDFIKCDSREAKTFTSIFHLLDPDVFVDNHVSDGADYQHIMTLITSQHNRLGGSMGEFMNRQFEPALFTRMKEKGYDLVPYVNHFSETPENGWTEFWDSPRYSSGYSSLWQTFSFIPETHMLKPYNMRVKATYTLMQCFIEYTAANSEKIKTVRAKARQEARAAVSFPIKWTNNKQEYSQIEFRGYKSGYKPSEVSGLPRLYYDRSKPFTANIKFYNSYTPVAFVNKPLAYIIPQGWWKVTDLLQLNKVQMRRLAKDTSIEVEVYHIDNYKTMPRQYEMHHMNSEVKLSALKTIMHFRKGDWYIPMNQDADRFIMETLEPQAEDSYFAWNFFDAILGQKEDYSNYVFEEEAAEYLSKSPGIKQQLEQQRISDTSFAKSAAAQLDFVYAHSPYLEPAYLRYPVYRLVR